MDRKFEHLAEYESPRDEFEFVTSLQIIHSLTDKVYLGRNS